MPEACAQFGKTVAYFATFPKLIKRHEATACMRLLDEGLYDYLRVEQRRIPPESIKGMKENYSDTLNKTMQSSAFRLLSRHHAS